MTQSPAVFPLILGATFSFILTACSDNGKPNAAAQARPPMPVTVKTMQPQTIPAFIEVVAQTEGARETEVRARVSGILEKQLYQEGENVKAGQPLFQIERTRYEIALASAQASADLASREVKRLKGLLSQRAVSRRDYDNAVSNNAIAQANLRQANLNLSWTTVTAPVAGTTGRAQVSIGTLLRDGSDTLLTSIYQLNPIWVRFSLAESDVAKLPDKRLTTSSISGVELLLPDGSVYPQKGHLNFLGSTIDPKTGTQQLRAEFANDNGRLLPGQFVRARLLLEDRKGVFLVPQSAVLQTDKGRLVMLAGEGDKVTPRPVQTAEWYGSDWIITSGLQAGDKVIIDNLIKLRPGMVVAPKALGEQPKPAGKS